MRLVSRCSVLVCLLLSASVAACAGEKPSESAPPPLSPPTVCNGRAELCDRRYDEVAFPATHNAMSSFEAGFAAANQNFGMKRQLEDGIRAMLFDTYFWNDDLYLCHGICELGHIPLVDALTEIRVFLEAHPYEVLTFIVEDHITPEQTATAFQKAGLDGLVYAHEAGAPWPTLRELLVLRKQIVVGAEQKGPPPEWYHHIWDIAWDTPYSFKNASEFTCALNRGSKDNDLFLLNHWIEDPLPTIERGEIANAYEMLSSRAKLCRDEGGQIPNFVAVNFYDLGALFQVVDELNGF